MKKLFFGLIVFIAMSNIANAQDTDFEKFFLSSEFQQLSKTYSIDITDVDKKNYGFIDHDSKNFKIYRVLVNVNSKQNFITFASNDNGNTYSLVYEKIDIANNIAEHLDEYGNLYATFIVTMTGDKYNFKINEVFSPETTGNRVNRWSTCVTRIYQQLKRACESDDVCDTLCDFQPFCHGMLLHWAVAYCLTH